MGPNVLVTRRIASESRRLRLGPSDAPLTRIERGNGKQSTLAWIRHRPGRKSRSKLGILGEQLIEVPQVGHPEGDVFVPGGTRCSASLDQPFHVGRRRGAHLERSGTQSVGRLRRWVQARLRNRYGDRQRGFDSESCRGTLDRTSECALVFRSKPGFRSRAHVGRA